MTSANRMLVETRTILESLGFLSGATSWSRANGLLQSRTLDPPVCSFRNDISYYIVEFHASSRNLKLWLKTLLLFTVNPVAVVYRR